MYNSFDPIGVKIKEFIIKYKYIVLGLLAVVIVLIILTTSSTLKKDNTLEDVEREITTYTLDYISKNKIIVTEELFISFDKIGYEIDPKYSCNKDGGIKVINTGEEYKYEYYYICEKYSSNEINEVLKHNEKSNKGIILEGDIFTLLKDNQSFEDPGYKLLVNGSVEKYENNYERNGLYYVDYVVNFDGKDYTATRIVAVEKSPQFVIATTIPTIELVGGDVTIKQGEMFIDPGYNAYDEKDGNLTDEVIKTGFIDVSKVGVYVRSYHVRNSDKIPYKISRIVIVEAADNPNDPIPTPDPDDEVKPSIVLYGNNPSSIMSGTTFNEPGYIATDKNGTDITDKVTVSGSVNESVVGNYNLTYKVTDNYGQETEVVRVVIVTKQTISVYITADTTTKVSDKVDIMASITGSYSYTLLPDSEIIKENNFTYSATENGTHIFRMYDTDGSYIERSVKIENITKNNIGGICRVDGSTVTVTADSSSPITGYSYQINGGAYTAFTPSSTHKAEKTIQSAKVRIADSNNNQIEIKCEKLAQKYNPIIPPGDIVWKANSDTLKINAVKDGRITVTYVWAEKPYEQYDLFATPSLNTKTATIKTLMNGALKADKLQNKIMIANNSEVSTYYYGRTAKYGKHSDTSYVLYQGKELANTVMKSGYDGTIFGINPYNELRAFLVYEGYNQEKRQAVLDDLRSSGVQNTFTGMQLLIYYGRAVNRKESPTYRSEHHWTGTTQRIGFCQIDNNNYAYFVASTTVYNIQKSMKKAGCQMGFNLDGGGSTTLLAKTKNESSLHRIDGVGSNGERGSMWGIGYWKEL